MKITIFFFAILCLGFGALHAEMIQITTFADMLEALEGGSTVRVIIHYAECELISDNEVKSYSPNAIGGMDLDVFEYFAPMMMGNPNGFIVCSESKLIDNPIGEGYVYNYVKIRISDDNKVKLTARYLDTQDYSEIMDEAFHSIINDGKNEGAVFLYLDD